MDEFLLTPEQMTYVAYPKKSLVFWVNNIQKYRIILPEHPDYEELLIELEETSGD